MGNWCKEDDIGFQKFEMPDDCFMVKFLESDYGTICQDIASVAEAENATVLHMGSVIETDIDGRPGLSFDFLTCGVIFKRKKHNKFKK